MSMSDQTANAVAGDEPPEIKTRPAEWFYVDQGARKGPVTEDFIRDLLAKKEIPLDAEVWRKGMSDWLPIRQSDLSGLVESEPPAVPGKLIGNGLVWILAVLPLIWGFIDASIVADNYRRAAFTGLTGAPYHAIKSLPWQVPVAFNLVFALWDEHRLKKPGLSDFVSRVTAAFLIPIYLFIRAKRLKQRPSYAITWIFMFLLAMLLIASASS